MQVSRAKVWGGFWRGFPSQEKRKLLEEWRAKEGSVSLGYPEGGMLPQWGFRSDEAMK